MSCDKESDQDAMNLAVCSIQRDRGPWLKEWVAFHHLVGVSKFYIYLHRCSDDSAALVVALSSAFDISAFHLSSDVSFPQLSAYYHCYTNFGSMHDWIAFIDGDEFLFPTASENLIDPLSQLANAPIDGVGVYWACFGSSWHLNEPSGLIVENYRRRADFDFDRNSHFKSILRGRRLDEFFGVRNGHYFQTRRGTFDTENRRLEGGLMDHPPTYNQMRINHYITQSREYFVRFKQRSGAADIGDDRMRTEQWWLDHDRNEVWDDSMERFLPKLKSLIHGLGPQPSKLAR